MKVYKIYNTEKMIIIRLKSVLFLGVSQQQREARSALSRCDRAGLQARRYNTPGAGL